MKTIAELQEKWWYRVIQIVYFVGVALNFIILLILVFVSMPFELAIGFMLVSTIAQLFVFGYFWPGVFYYVVLGKFSPPLK